jgi:hypothetical protein
MDTRNVGGVRVNPHLWLPDTQCRVTVLTTGAETLRQRTQS